MGSQLTATRSITRSSSVDRIPTKMPCLVVADEPEAQVHSIPEGVTRIGRSRRNDLRIKDSSVSRFHCYILRIGNESRIYDAKSENATRVGKWRAEGQRLENGMEVVLGRRRLLFRSPETFSPRQAPGVIRMAPVEQTSPFAWALSLLCIGLFFGVVVTALVDLGRVIRGEQENDRSERELEISSQAWADQKRGLRARLNRFEQDLSSMNFLEKEKKRVLEDLRQVRHDLVELEGEWQGRHERVRAELKRSREEKGTIEAEFEKVRNENLALAEAMRQKTAELASLQQRLDGLGRAGSHPFRSESSRVEEASAVLEPPRSSGPPASGGNPKELAAQIRGALETYASPDASASDLQPELDQLGSMHSEEVIEALFRLYADGQKMLQELEKSLGYSGRKADGYLRAADRYKRGGGSPGGSSARVETAQRKLELHAKKRSIQEQQRSRLASMVAAIKRKIIEDRTPADLRWLAGRLSKVLSDEILVDTLLEALEASGGISHVPTIIECLRSGKTATKERVQRALVKLTGEDHGTSRSRWKTWWNETNRTAEPLSGEDQ